MFGRSINGKHRSKPPSGRGVRYARYTEREIYACPQRIFNWARVVAWLSAIRGRSIYSEHVEVVSLVNARGLVSIGEIQELGTGQESACYVAAALKAVQDGLFVSDNELPAANSIIKYVERGHETSTLPPSKRSRLNFRTLAGGALSTSLAWPEDEQVRFSALKTGIETYVRTGKLRTASRNAVIQARSSLSN